MQKQQALYGTTKLHIMNLVH